MRCPICNDMMESLSKHSIKLRCKRGCYSRAATSVTMVETVFGEEFVFDMFDGSSTWEKKEARLNKKIEYWKKNDRYLAELLTRS